MYDNKFNAATAKYSWDRQKLYRPRFIYFAVKDEFPQVERHIASQQRRLGLDVLRSSSGIVQGIADYLAVSSGGRPLAFVLGTRRGDPNCGEQQSFSPSSAWMPPFMVLVLVLCCPLSPSSFILSIYRSSA